VVVERDLEVLELLQVVLQLGREVDREVLGQVADRLQQVREAVAPVLLGPRRHRAVVVPHHLG
jgi:hypothetical protein